MAGVRGSSLAPPTHKIEGPAAQGPRMLSHLVKPKATHLESYILALEKGWTLDLRGAAAAAEQLTKVREDPAAFLCALEHRSDQRSSIQLPDGSWVPRLPGFQRWIWDGAFCGAVGLRWQPGTTELPVYCLGHVGYGVVPWKQGRGYATAALGQILPEAKVVGLPHIDLTTDPDNSASQKVITRNGGVLIKRFSKPAQFGGKPGLLFRIYLDR